MDLDTLLHHILHLDSISVPFGLATRSRDYWLLLVFIWTEIKWNRNTCNTIGFFVQIHLCFYPRSHIKMRESRGGQSNTKLVMNIIRRKIAFEYLYFPICKKEKNEFFNTLKKYFGIFDTLKQIFWNFLAS